MVEVPTPTIVTTFLEIVATSGFELVYVKAPLLLVVGGVTAKGAFPITFTGTEKSDIAVTVLLTTRAAVMNADVLFVVLA